MNFKFFRFLPLFLLSLAFIIGNAKAEGDKKESNNQLSKVQGAPVRAYLDINNLSTVLKNDGISDIDAQESNSGLVFPKGSGKAAVFTSGFLWGLKIPGDPQPRVGGTAYRTGLQGGKITNSGLAPAQLTAEDPEAANVRIYRVRPDVFPGGPTVDLSSEASVEGLSASDVRTQYEADWTNWPAADGAPYNDVDASGSYDPSVDVPGVPGANQTIWFVGNDLNPGRTTNLYGAQPVGMEMQATIWAYSQTGALGNMFFRKYKLINKSNSVFDSTYVSMWSDVDLGNSTDDFAGCDTTLSLGFVYNANANDATYNPLPPPAVGFDFFQGPLLAGVAGEDRNKNGVDDAADFGISNGIVVGPGFVNLPMTSYYYFARGDASVTDPTQGDIQGSTQFYNFFQGRIGLTGALFVDPNTNLTTTYALAGDAQNRKGWIDGQLIGPGDRRMGMASGPFQMAPGDTQEVVVAEIAAGAIPGVDRLSAIGLLKFYDQQAQLAYDNFFDLPVAPAAPDVNVVESDQEIILDWGENNAKVQETESQNAKGYQFQGYNVYQLPSASADVTQGIRIATFDINDGIGKIFDDVFDVKTGSVVNLPVQFGNDTGIKRFLSITTDAIKGGVPLVNGIRYYFAVTAYNYNPNAAVSTALENPLRIITVVPHSTEPGVGYEFAYSDTVSSVTHTAGGSDGNVYPIVVDPSKLTGLNYSISFAKMTVTAVNDTGGVDTSLVDVWNVDRSDGVRVLSNQTNQNADESSPIADGIQFRVIGAPLDFKNFSVVANANGPLDPPDGGAFDFGNFPSIRPTAAQQVGDGLWGIHTADNGGSNDGGSRGLYDAFISRATRDGANWPLIIPYDFEMRFTGTNATPGVGGSQAYEAFNDGNVFWVPFELWNIGIGTPNDPSDDYRLVPYIIDDAGTDNSGDNIFDLESWGSSAAGSGDLEHSVSGGDNDPFTDWVYWERPTDISPGQAGYLAAETEMLAGTYAGDRETEILARIVLVNWNGGSAPPFNQDLPEMGTIFRIESTKPNAAGVDIFTFAAPAPTTNVEQAREDVKKINVFPNPYYGVNSEELNKYNRFVTFNHLPTKAKIRIFNLAGVLVKTIDKDETSQFMRWDLANETGLPVASGLYLAYIEMPDLGTTKILKLAIIQEQQILDRF